MNTEMFAAESQMRLMTMNDATGKIGRASCREAPGGKTEHRPDEEGQQEACRDPSEGEQHRAPEILLDQERKKTAQHRRGGR